MRINSVMGSEYEADTESELADCFRAWPGNGEKWSWTVYILRKPTRFAGELDIWYEKKKEFKNDSEFLAWSLSDLNLGSVAPELASTYSCLLLPELCW